MPEGRAWAGVPAATVAAAAATATPAIRAQDENFGARIGVSCVRWRAPAGRLGVPVHR